MKKRNIVFDTETTGVSVFDDRVVEIACVELDGFMPTGRTPVEVRFDGDTAWLSLGQMAQDLKKTSGDAA